MRLCSTTFNLELFSFLCQWTALSWESNLCLKYSKDSLGSIVQWPKMKKLFIMPLEHFHVGLWLSMPTKKLTVLLQHIVPNFVCYNMRDYPSFLVDKSIEFLKSIQAIIKCCPFFCGGSLVQACLLKTMSSLWTFHCFQ
jgi:hypothetical protein